MSEDLAWAAGFFEGEGTIGCWDSTVVLQVNQQNTEPLIRLKSIWGGSIYATKQTANGRDIYCFSLYGQRPVLNAIMDMWPWLSDRRRVQAADALDRSADKAALREYFCGKKRHVRTPENTAIRSNGSRRCQDCEREAWKRRTLLNSSR